MVYHTLNTESTCSSRSDQFGWGVQVYKWEKWVMVVKRWLDLIVIHELGSLPLYLVVLFPSAFLPPLTHSHRVDGWVGGWVGAMSWACPYNHGVISAFPSFPLGLPSPSPGVPFRMTSARERVITTEQDRSSSAGEDRPPSARRNRGGRSSE